MRHMTKIESNMDMNLLLNNNCLDNKSTAPTQVHLFCIGSTKTEMNLHCNNTPKKKNTVTSEDPLAFTDEGFQDISRPNHKKAQLSDSWGDVTQYQDIHHHICYNYHQRQVPQEEKTTEDDSPSSFIKRLSSPPAGNLKRIKPQHRLLDALSSSCYNSNTTIKETHEDDKMDYTKEKRKYDQCGISSIRSSCAPSPTNRIHNWGQHIDIEVSPFSKRSRFVC